MLLMDLLMSDYEQARQVGFQPAKLAIFLDDVCHDVMQH
jgi:hypothetical protein